MGKAQVEVIIAAAPVTTNPVANVPNEVLAMGGGNYGALCKCNGTVTPPNPGAPASANFVGLYFKMVRGSNTPISKEQVVAAPDRVISKYELYGNGPAVVTKDWNLNTQLTADCGPAGSELPNCLCAVTRTSIYNPANMPPFQDLLELTSTPFKGKSVSACAVAALGPVAARAAAPVLASASVSGTIGVPASPTDRDGDWLLYGGLTTTSFHFGNRLMLNGQPLHARVLAVAVANVNWSTAMFVYPPVAGLMPHRVRRAVGDLRFETIVGIPWRFPNAPLHSVAIWQNKFGLPEHVVSSECRQSPNLVHVDPDEDVLVQVNYNSIVHPSCAGTYDLWVKVID